MSARTLSISTSSRLISSDVTAQRLLSLNEARRACRSSQATMERASPHRLEIDQGVAAAPMLPLPAPDGEDTMRGFASGRRFLMATGVAPALVTPALADHRGGGF